MSKYSSYNVQQLKAELKQRNAKTTGRKKELVERLESYDRNEDFGQDAALEPEYSMKLPDRSLYKDIHTGMKLPAFELSNITAYLSAHDQVLSKNAKNMCRERFLKYIRVYSDGNDLYIYTHCKAMMKKSVCYYGDIKLSRNTILECQCECAVGMGPTAHCKHVAAALYAFHLFTVTGEIFSEITCTQTLQTFHHCKPHQGSPVKAANLEIVQNKPHDLIFDPRPPKYRAGGNFAYQDYFRNVCLNMPGVSTVPIFQLTTPANPYALAHDHDYCQDTMEDHFLKALSLHSITPSRRLEIFNKTRGQAGNQNWYMERSTRLTSSNFGRISKATDRTDFEKLARSLTCVKKIKSAALSHGRRFEPVALAAYKRQTGLVTSDSGLVVSANHPYLAASPDAMVSDDLLVEIKCPYTSRNSKINNVTVPYLEKCDAGVQYELKKNHDYYYQVQGQLFCTGAKECDFVVFTFQDLYVVRIRRDDEFIRDMVTKLKAFFSDYFKIAVLDRFLYKDYYRYSW